MTDPRRRAVTIVVPVYGDLPSLIECVESLEQNVDLTHDQVLLVNDCGPDADEIERALLDRIGGVAGFRYERNERNLGFVGNCNRAVLELDTTDNDILLLNSDTITTPGFVDELSAVLHLSPTHGVVCPRSNNATIASLPYQLRVPSSPRTIERSREVHRALAETLPRFSIAPVSMGFCFLIRRELIARFGLFDEVFAPGYGEENDFCLRVNAHGFSALIAHRVIVFHAGSLSFVGERRNTLRTAHEAILASRYPWYGSMVQSYLHVDRDPVDVFADALVPGDDSIRVLVEFGEGPIAAQTATAIVETLRALPDDRLVLTVSAPPGARREVAARFPGISHYAASAVSGIWDAVMFDPAAIDPSRLPVLNRFAPRWIVSVGDLGGTTRWADRAANSTASAAMREALTSAEAVLASDDSTALAVASLLTTRRVDSSTILTTGPERRPETADALLDLLRRPVDTARLRARWMRQTSSAPRSTPALGPRPSFARRVARRLARISPRAAGAAHSVLRRVRGA